MRRCLGRLRTPHGLAFVITALVVTPGVGQEVERLTLSRDTVPVIGRHVVDVAVPTFGRYAVLVESERGSAVQVIDRAAGPGPIDGLAGETNGRIDTFFDRGTVRVVVHGLAEDPAPDGPAGENTVGEETTTVRVEPFHELSADAVALSDLAFVETRLGDLEARSWWLDLATSQRVVLEAAGRHLADLRIWRDGTWLVGNTPRIDTIEPVEGQPLRRLRLTAQLEPGLYKLTAYGGEAVPWAVEGASGAAAEPLYLRSGMPRLGEATRQRVELSPFGEEHFVVPGTATFFRLETGPAGPAGHRTSLRIEDYVDTAPWSSRSAQTGVIRKQTNPPVVELERQLDVGQPRRVTIRGRAGEVVVLQSFLVRPVYQFSENGSYWLSTVSSGSPGDALDATAILVRNQDRRDHRRAMTVRGVDLVDGMEWRRRFNLLATATLYLQVVDSGTYDIRCGGDAVAGLRLEPFAIPGTRAATYRSPEFRERRGTWQLDPGVYELTLEPRRPGIAELWIRDSVPSSEAAAKPAPPVQPEVRFGVVDLQPMDSYTLYLNQRPGVRTGIVLRQVPLDLEQPLPLVLDAGDSVSLSARPGAGEIEATTEAGRPIEVASNLDGSWRVQMPADAAGPAAVSVRRRVPAREGTLPSLPTGRLDALPDLPILTDGEAAYLDLGRGRRATYRVQAATPGLYRLESTGLLDTLGTVRTRTIPVLEQVAEGGAGRNFSIRRYLAPGDYQLSVEARGRSAGRLGLRLAQTPVLDGGELELAVPARGWLDAGEAVAYRFEVETGGRFRWRSLGLGQAFRARLEDAAGWPLVTPGVEADVELDLEPGVYRWIVLPRAVRARQVTWVEPVIEPVARQGHGPHPLALGEVVHHRWREPAEGGERAPDVWRFELSAPATVQATLSPEMTADVVRVAADGVASEGVVSDGVVSEVVGELAPRQPFSRWLEAGSYRVRARAVRVDDRRDYQLRVWASELLPGDDREVSLPDKVRLSVAEDGLFELTTLGDVDARAMLADADGQVLARADDRPGDWNIRLAHRLRRGVYDLHLEAIDPQSNTRLRLRQLREVELPSLELVRDEVAERTLTPGGEALRLPVTIPPTSDVVLVSAESTENVRLTVEAGAGVGGADEGRATTLMVPVVSPPIRPGDPPTRVEQLVLRLESLDSTGQATRLKVVALDLDPVSEARAVRLASRPPAGFEMTPVVVDLDRAGCFQVTGAAVASRVGLVASPVQAAVSAPRRLWLAVEGDGGSVVRAVVPDGGVLRVSVPPGDTAACDLGPSDPRATTSGGVDHRVIVARGVGAPAAVQGVVGDDPFGWWYDAIDASASMASFRARGVDDDASAVFEPATMAILRVDSSAAAPVEVELSARRVAGMMRRTAEVGSSSFAVAPGGAVWIELPEVTTLRTTVNLSRGLLAAGGGDHVLWANDAALHATYDGVGGVVVADVAGEGGQVAVEALPQPERGLMSVSATMPLEHRAATAGRLDLPQSRLEGSTLTLGVRDLWVVGHDGSLGRGHEAVDSGRLVVDHDAGAVVIWPFDPAAPLRHFWADDRPPATEALTLPAVAGLGAAGHRFSITVDSPRILHVRAATSALVGIERPGLPDHLTGQLDALVLDIPLPAGESSLSLRGIAGAPLVGPLSAWTDTALPLAEGLGPETLLGPGQARSYSVHIPAGGARRLGFGVAAESDVVEGRVLDHRGQELGRGVLQWHDLEPGDYFFILDLAADSEPVRVRPAIVGLERPSTGPPPEVAEEYWRRVRAAGAAR